MGELVKTPLVTIIPGTPTLPAEPPVIFHLYATPPPQGVAYRQKGNFPSIPAHFSQWSQTWTPDGPFGAPNTSWYAPIARMTYITFPDVDTAPNGFPLIDGDGPVEGYFDIPTVTGIHRETRQFFRNGRHGTFTPYGGSYSDPPYCTTGGGAGPTMFAGFPGRGPIPGLPETEGVDHNEGWNEGARSALELEGDMFTEFQVDITAAGAVGLTRHPRASMIDPSNLQFAFYFDRAGGAKQVSIMENGLIVKQLGAYDPEALFRIERIEGAIAYTVAGSVVYRSRNLSNGAMVVGTSLYRAGDKVL